MTEREMRRFNDRGVAAAESLLTDLDEGRDCDIPELLGEPDLTEGTGEPIEIIPFRNRRDAAEHLDEGLRSLQDVVNIERDRGLWTWLALAWIDELAPAVLGERKIRAHSRWILAVDDYRKYYRHLLAGPYYVYRAHRDDPDRAMAVLATAVESPGDIVESVASRQDIVRSPGLMEVFTRLYFDFGSGTLKKGAASKSDGSARRLAKILMQYDLTWDIVGMSSDEILDLLPQEFDRFR